MRSPAELCIYFKLEYKKTNKVQEYGVHVLVWLSIWRNKIDYLKSEAYTLQEKQNMDEREVGNRRKSHVEL